MKLTAISDSHLTVARRRAIRSIIAAGRTSGRVGRTDYYLTEEASGVYRVRIRSTERDVFGRLSDEWQSATVRVA